MSSSYQAMGDFLQRHAYQNVWCTPNQDKQAILQPARLSTNGGVWRSVKVMWRDHLLPDTTSRFHVYQIGQVHPLLLGLANKQNQWVSVPDACKSESLIADFYTLTGIQIPRSQVWYRVTQEKNLIIAVRLPDQNKIPANLDSETLFMRLYSNEYFHSMRADGANDVINVDGLRVGVTQDILDFQARLAQWRAKPTGHTYCFINGFVVDNISLVNAVVGDYIEFVYDGSIKRVVNFPISELLEFNSSLDQLYKYLLHYPGVTDMIDYHDDVDLFLVKPGSNNTFKGVYFHKNDERAIRMVTHKDYSVPVAHISYYPNARPEIGPNMDVLSLRLHVRHSGYSRPLVFEHNRVQDLYRMSDSEVVAAMIGVDATVSVWTADALESSDYCKLMREVLGGISREEVQMGYGYNAVSKLLADTPTHVETINGMRGVKVPVGLTTRATAYEYDADGKLLEWHHHFNGTFYPVQNPNAALVEMIAGYSENFVESHYGEQIVTIAPGYNYRFYTCGMNLGVPDNNWVDRTGSSYYAIQGNAAHWVTNPALTYTLVRSNANHLAYSFNLQIVDGIITFAIQEWRPELNQFRPMTVPMGELDVFLNDWSLIEGLDYFVEFPRVTIVNKKYLNDPANLAQKITIRMTGFCDSDMKLTPPGDVGFVDYGVLSFNNRYDIRDDKVNRIIVGGALYRYDELHYGEEDFDIHVTDASNGSPYSIRDIVVPMNDYLSNSGATQDPTYTLRARSRAVDKEVSDYLTLKIPQKDPVPPSAIPSLYPVVSPFFSKIVADLLSGALWDDTFQQHYSNDWVRQKCAPYEYLLAWDPIVDQNLPDLRYVVIHPHELPNYVDMGIYQFKFLSRVHALYANGRLELSSHVRVAQFT